MTLYTYAKNQIYSYAALLRNKVRRPEIAALMKNFSMTFIFKGFALVFLLIINVVSVRELGVIAWGKIALIMTIANIVVIPLTLGIQNGVIKYVPIASKEEKQQLIGSALIANLLPSILLTTVMIVMAPLIEQFTGFSAGHWIAAVALAMALNLYIVTESFLRSQQFFFKMGLLKLITTGLFLFGTLCNIYIFKITSIYAYVVPAVIHHIIFFFVALMGSKLVPFTISKEVMTRLYHYGLFIMLSWFVSALLFSSDMFLVAYFTSDHDLGVYSIYQNSIRGLCTILFHDVFAVVFMPFIAAKNRQQLDRVIMRYFGLIFVLIWLFASVITVLLVLLFGDNVPLDWIFVVVTSAGIAMNIMYLLVTTVIAMDSVKAAKWVFIALVVPVPLVLICQFYFVKLWGIMGGMFSIIVVNACLIITVRLLIHKFYMFNQSVRKENA